MSDQRSFDDDEKPITWAEFSRRTYSEVISVTEAGRRWAADNPDDRLVWPDGIARTPAEVKANRERYRAARGLADIPENIPEDDERARQKAALSEREGVGEDGAPSPAPADDPAPPTPAPPAADREENYAPF